MRAAVCPAISAWDCSDAALVSSIPYPEGFNQTFNTPFPAYSTIYAGARNATLHEYAVFGELSWNITDKLKASAGIRAFEVKQGFSQGGDGLLNGDALSGGLATTATATSNVGGYAITQGSLLAIFSDAGSRTRMSLS